jgi:hypothetical protein
MKNKKNLLLIMPKFFDYPEIITEELNRINYNVDFFDDRPSTSSMVKAIIRVKKSLINGYIKNYFNNIMKTIETKKYDVVLLISGQSLSFTEKMMDTIKKSQPQAKFILYQWDSLKNFPYILNMHRFFDKKFSFDREDCSKNKNLNFLPLFFSEKYENIGKNTGKDYRYDFCFVGTAHPKKYKFIKIMSEQLKKVYPKQFIYYFFPSKIVYYYRKLKNPEFKNAKISEFHFKPVNGIEMDNLISESRCILDSAQEGQLGLTIRVLEALGAKKKLITTNKDVINYDFYKKENIYIYDGVFDYNSVFFNSDYVELDDKIYQKYSLRSWIHELLK